MTIFGEELTHVRGIFGMDPTRLRPKKYSLSMPRGPFSPVSDCAIFSALLMYG